ncbi:trans-2-decenoyl-[acyl-carrier-protein] isomerase [Clostridium homopropionicum DSM 5847]|uniref:short-chain-enoyl-CoA hydratase n=1 Tax=Clostridium homopropionicum DSM 5847 TaxID=1121318 RepID=A0A0L6Z685_9CLOT|nr:enoyl-CoA hydratase-related protein [Clostridium homopropionicum]KOA18471.1 trans-2-decenoyl-[acyl-carrier-protein] isomerase [Clostridium homopropionicum DSM 5847]SFF66230.1 trans-2-decenoyl-[acyl-carrier protein] isomerase [Clostridium homopropionicum]
MSYEKIIYGCNNGVAKITLNSKANLNAFDHSLITEVIDALDKCESNPEVKVVILNGAGKAFSGGGDIAAMYKAINEGQDLEELVELAAQMAIKIKKLPKPVIASVHGPAAGAGFNVALACDLCIAAEDALFIQAFVNIGLIPDAGGVYLLTRSVGVSKACELALSGKRISAKEAFDMGIVAEICSIDELEEKTNKLALKMAKGPAVSYKNTKELIYKAQFSDFEEYLKEEVKAQVQCGKTEDFKEGMKAFLEKRKPNYIGR